MDTSKAPVDFAAWSADEIAEILPVRYGSPTYDDLWNQVEPDAEQGPQLATVWHRLTERTRRGLHAYHAKRRAKMKNA